MHVQLTSGRQTASFHFICYCFQGVCTEAGMYALRERRVHVTQEDFELAVAKVGKIQLISKSIIILITCILNTCKHLLKVLVHITSAKN